MFKLLRRLKLSILPEYRFTLQPNLNGVNGNVLLNKAQVYSLIMKIKDVANSDIYMRHGILPTAIFEELIANGYVKVIKHDAYYYVSNDLVTAGNGYVLVEVSH